MLLIKAIQPSPVHSAPVADRAPAAGIAQEPHGFFTIYSVTGNSPGHMNCATAWAQAPTQIKKQALCNN